jgi:hypothetical protein
MLYYLVAMHPVRVAAMPFCFRISHGWVGCLANSKPGCVHGTDRDHDPLDPVPFSVPVYTRFLTSSLSLLSSLFCLDFFGPVYLVFVGWTPCIP